MTLHLWPTAKKNAKKVAMQGTEDEPVMVKVLEMNQHKD